MTDNDFIELQKLIVKSDEDCILRRRLEMKEINSRLDTIEELVVAHQSWAVLRDEDRKMHMSVRNLLNSIRDITK